MASGTRGTNTFMEVLNQILGLVSQAKVTPDADLQWLVPFETMLIQRIRQPQDEMAQRQAQVLAQYGGGNAGSGMVLPSPGAGAPSPAMPPTQAPPPNLRTNPQIPPDAVTRLLAATR